MFTKINKFYTNLDEVSSSNLSFYMDMILGGPSEICMTRGATYMGATPIFLPTAAYQMYVKCRSLG